MGDEQGIVRRTPPEAEFYFHERCWILEAWNDGADPAASIARARVEPGITTKAHRLEGIIERYVILKGNGTATVGGAPVSVEEGDVVVIPAGVSQQIRNDGESDLIFLCVCTPRFEASRYESIEG